MLTFADLEIYNMASNGSQLVLTEEQVLKTLAKADVKRNQHFLSTLGFTARKVGTFGRKLLVTKKVIDTVTEIEGTPETEKLYELAQDLYALEKEISELYNEFSTLYLKENKSSFLNELKQRYLSLRSCLFAKAMECKLPRICSITRDVRFATITKKEEITKSTGVFFPSLTPVLFWNRFRQNNLKTKSNYKRTDYAFGNIN
mgnify:CR=1 FL=1